MNTLELLTSFFDDSDKVNIHFNRNVKLESTYRNIDDRAIYTTFIKYGMDHIETLLACNIPFLIFQYKSNFIEYNVLHYDGANFIKHESLNKNSDNDSKKYRELTDKIIFVDENKIKQFNLMVNL